jgi:hypothetical protein
MAAQSRRKNTSGQQDGSPDLFSELVDPKAELRLETVKFVDLCLGADVSDEDFDSALKDLKLSNEQCHQITAILKDSDYDLAQLSFQTNDAELAFLTLRLILGCVF